VHQRCIDRRLKTANVAINMEARGRIFDPNFVERR